MVPRVHGGSDRNQGDRDLRSTEVRGSWTDVGVAQPQGGSRQVRLRTSTGGSGRSSTDPAPVSTPI